MNCIRDLDHSHLRLHLVEFYLIMIVEEGQGAPMEGAKIGAGSFAKFSEKAGVYRYEPSDSPNGKAISLDSFHKKEGLALNNIHRVLEDREGQLWFGGFGGLDRYDGNSFVNMTKDESWGLD